MAKTIESSTLLSGLARSGLHSLTLLVLQYTTAIVKQNFTNLQASIYPQAGHACFYDQPAAVAFDIINFVESNT
jgi:pimeloyl-ACP methyl ester carboxylesterase